MAEGRYVDARVWANDSGKYKGQDAELLVHDEEQRVVDQALEPPAESLQSDQAKAARFEERAPLVGASERAGHIHHAAVPVAVEPTIEQVQPEPFARVAVDGLDDEQAGARDAHGLPQDRLRGLAVVKHQGEERRVERALAKTQPRSVVDGVRGSRQQERPDVHSAGPRGCERAEGFRHPMGSGADAGRGRFR